MLYAIQTKIAVAYVDIPSTEIEGWVLGGKKAVGIPTRILTFNL